jgi:hypothetical protein
MPIESRPDKIEDESIANARLIMSLIPPEPEKVKVLSDLDDDEVYALTVLYSWGEKIKSSLIKTFADNFLQLRRSRYRLGIRELVLLASLVAGGMLPSKKGMKDFFSMRI